MLQAGNLNSLRLSKRRADHRVQCRRTYGDTAYGDSLRVERQLMRGFVLANVKAVLLVRPELVQVGRGGTIIEVVAARESSDERKRKRNQVPS
jgi:hypothetical protein